MLELLRRRSLLVHVVGLAVAERPVDGGAAAGIDGIDLRVIDALLVDGVFEHRHRLQSVVDQDLAADELVPGEVGIGFPAGDEEAILQVDLREMYDVLRLALVERRPARSEEHTSELQSLMRTSYAVF